MAETPNPHDAWARRPDESAKAHAACMVYLRLGADRSITKVGQSTGRPNAAYRTVVGRWSSKFGWVERARAYDAEQEREMWRASLALRDRALRTLTDEAAALAEVAIEVAKGKAPADAPQVAMLRDLLTRMGLYAPKVTTTKAETERAADGATETTTTTTTEDVERLTADDLARAYLAVVR